MARSRGLLRAVVIVVTMTICSFCLGWHAYGRHHSDAQRMQFDFSKPYLIPRTHEPIGRKPSADTASFAVGDRLDIFVRAGDSLEPLIVDAIVTSQGKKNFGMLLPDGGRDLLNYARENGLPLVFRPTVATTDPIVLDPYPQTARP